MSAISPPPGSGRILTMGVRLWCSFSLVRLRTDTLYLPFRCSSSTSSNTANPTAHSAPKFTNPRSASFAFLPFARIRPSFPLLTLLADFLCLFALFLIVSDRSEEEGPMVGPAFPSASFLSFARAHLFLLPPNRFDVSQLPSHLDSSSLLLSLE